MGNIFTASRKLILPCQVSLPNPVCKKGVFMVALPCSTTAAIATATEKHSPPDIPLEDAPRLAACYSLSFHKPGLYFEPTEKQVQYLLNSFDVLSRYYNDFAAKMGAPVTVRALQAMSFQALRSSPEMTQVRKPQHLSVNGFHVETKNQSLSADPLSTVFRPSDTPCAVPGKRPMTIYK